MVTEANRQEYDYEEENTKVCPVCGTTIDYHVAGFFHDKILNIWICRHHTLASILHVVALKDEDAIRFILSGEIEEQFSQFMKAYRNACAALEIMNNLWEDPLVARLVQSALVGEYPENMVTFEEFVRSFRSIW